MHLVCIGVLGIHLVYTGYGRHVPGVYLGGWVCIWCVLGRDCVSGIYFRG